MDDGLTRLLKKPGSRQAFQLLFLLALTGVLGLWISPLTQSTGTDREVFRYVGMVIHNGGMPYVDVFDHKPPLIYLLAALFHPFGPFGFWFAEVLLFAMSALVLYFTASRRGWSYPLLYCTLWAFLYWAPFINQGAGLTRGFTASATIAILCLLPFENPLALFAVGALFAFVGLTQQEEILGMIPLLIWDFLRRNKKEKLSCLRWWTAGFCVVMLATLVWIVSHGAWAAFLEDAFLFNLRHPSSRALSQKVSAIGFPGSVWVWVGLPVLISVWGITLSNDKQERGWLAGAAVGLTVQYFSSGLLGKQTPAYYLLGLIPYLTLISILWMQIIFRRSHRHWMAILFFAGGCVITSHLLGRDVWDLRPLIQNIGHPAYYSYRHPLLLAEIAPYRHQRGQLFILQNPSLLVWNTDFDIISPTPYVYFHFWGFQWWDEHADRLRSILDNLDHYKTAVVIDYSSQYPLVAMHQNLWFRYRDQHYRRVLIGKDGGELYKRIS